MPTRACQVSSALSGAATPADPEPARLDGGVNVTGVVPIPAAAAAVGETLSSFTLWRADAPAALLNLPQPVPRQLFIDGARFSRSSNTAEGLGLTVAAGAVVRSAATRRLWPTSRGCSTGALSRACTTCNHQRRRGGFEKETTTAAAVVAPAEVRTQGCSSRSSSSIISATGQTNGQLRRARPRCSTRHPTPPPTASASS